MTETITAGAADPQSQYDADYYHSHCGDVPYSSDSPVWQAFYQPIADEIVRSLGPRRVFDAGCAVGFLVAALWDRNVEAHGRDISEFAISQVRADVRGYCSVGSIADPIDGDFDLILCVEVLEHMPEDEAVAAIATMTAAAPRILFSSTPSDLDEVSHVNVRPTLYWLRQFAAAGFAPVGSHDASYLCPHAILFERSDAGRSERDLVAFAEVIRQRILRADEHRQLVQAQSALEAEQTARRVAEAGWRAHADAVEADLTKRLDDAQNHIQELHDRYRLSQVALRQARRAARVAWWTVSLQLPARMQDRRERMARDSTPPDAPPGGDEVAPGTADVRERIASAFGALEPLQTFSIPGAERRFS
ncbi:MAG: class I SAM-dependent methyltransferase, partial [Solirubrobacteraceae bacterium]